MYIVLLCHVIYFLSAASSPTEVTPPPTTSPPQTVGTTSPPKNVGTTSPPQTVGTTSPPQTVGTTSPPQTVETTSPPQTVGTTSPPQTVGTTSPPKTVGTTSPPQTVGTTSPPQTVGISPPQTVETTSPPQTVETIVTTGTVPFSSIQPTNNPSSDGATTTSVIIVAAVGIILVVIVVGVVILVVLLKAKKKKQKLVLSQLQNVTGEKEIGELELKQDKTNRKEVSSKPEQPLYAVVQEKASSRSEDVDQTCALSEYKMAPAGCEYALTATFPQVVNLTNPMFKEMESNPIYQSMNQCHDPSCTTNVPQGDDVYIVPDIINSHTVETKSGTHETVYSEPIQPSLFMVAAGNPSDSEDLQPYGPIY